MFGNLLGVVPDDVVKDYRMAALSSPERKRRTSNVEPRTPNVEGRAHSDFDVQGSKFDVRRSPLRST
jgi:hypothetical protein